MLTKTWEYIAVFKKDDKTWKENPTESNSFSEWVFWNEYMTSVFRNFLKNVFRQSILDLGAF